MSEAEDKFMDCFFLPEIMLCNQFTNVKNWRNIYIYLQELCLHTVCCYCVLVGCELLVEIYEYMFGVDIDI